MAVKMKLVPVVPTEQEVVVTLSRTFKKSDLDKARYEGRLAAWLDDQFAGTFNANFEDDPYGAFEAL